MVRTLGVKVIYLALAILCIIATAGLAYDYGAAMYGARCTLDAELIGHPVPGFADTAHGITNAYPVIVTADTHAIIGFIYTTLGGIAYFVPTEGGVQRHVAFATAATSTPIGSNKDIAGRRTLIGAPAVKVKRLLAEGYIPRFFVNDANRGAACYSKDWNGKIPSPKGSRV